MTDLLHERLKTLHAQTQPDGAFSDHLEAELREAFAQTAQPVSIKPRPIGRTRLYRWLGLIAASLMIVMGLFATVPPLRLLAEEVVRYFVPGAFNPAPASEPYYPELLETVEQAEAIAGFDILEWKGEGYQTFGIYANPSQSSGVAYQKLPLISPAQTIWLWQQVPGAPDANATEPVGDGANVQGVMVNGVEGEYVQGMWFSETKDGPTTWRPDLMRQLRWQKDNMIYRLAVSVEIADTPEEVVALAESLR